MTVTETILVFVGIPLAVILLFALLIYGASSRRARRYRPGRSFSFTPVWYVAGRDNAVAPTAEITPALTTAERRRQLETSHVSRSTSADAVRDSVRIAVAVAENPAPTTPVMKKGGARGTW